MEFTILRFESIESTNDEAIRQAKLGAPEGLCVVARSQTKGRGRHGRTWLSPPDAGLYFSLLLRPKLEPQALSLITLMSAIAVHDTLESLYHLDCDIKWVNDILVKDRKICGILTETCETYEGTAVVVGIGVNLLQGTIQLEIADIATSVEEETGKKPSKEDLIDNLTANLEQYYKILQSEDGPKRVCREWITRSSYAFGKRVRAKTERGVFEGVTAGLTWNGALILQLDSKEKIIISTGEVEQLRKT